MQELQRFVPAMYECTLVRLRATDMDQEVKERAIAACGQLICHFGDYLEVSQYPPCYVAHHRNVLFASLDQVYFIFVVCIYFSFQIFC